MKHESGAAADYEANYEERKRTIQRHRAPDRPTQFSLLGRTWDLLPEVYAPVYAFSTTVFTQWVPYPVGGSMLEVGSGAGITAVTAALSGCDRVVAVDINQAAVDNTRRNAERHGVADRVDARLSDLFDAVAPEESFDLIYWNSNFVEVASTVSYTSDLDRAFFDPGYECHKRFLATAGRFLRPGGRLMLGFANLGNREHLAHIAALNGRRVRIETEGRRTGADGQVLTFQLLELTPATSANVIR